MITWSHMPADPIPGPSAHHDTCNMQADRVSERLGGRGHISIRHVTDIAPSERDQMFALLERYYLHASREQFETDLAEKEWIVLGKEPSADRVFGFTTLMRLRTTVDGAPVNAFFSGDTVSASAYWARAETSRGIGLLLQHMLEIAEDDGSRWHWFLVSSTYRSYRLLPMIFREFHPSPHCATPPYVTRALEALVRKKFGGGYDSRASVVRFPHPTVFRPGFDANSGGRADHWEEFFLRTNLGHGEGDRLASLTVLSTDNLTALGARLLGRSAPEPAASMPSRV